MKLLHMAETALLPLLVVGRVVHLSPRLNAVTNVTSLLSPSDVFTAAGDPSVAPKSETWQKYTCRGQRLWQAMVNNKDKAGNFLTPIDTPFDSTLEDELKHWGYIERNDDADDQCMFDKYLRKPLEALNIDPKGSVRGGPNECFYFQHYDPSKKDEEGFLVPEYKQTYQVAGKTYKVSTYLL